MKETKKDIDKEESLNREDEEVEVFEVVDLEDEQMEPDDMEEGQMEPDDMEEGQMEPDDMEEEQMASEDMDEEQMAPGDTEEAVPTAAVKHRNPFRLPLIVFGILVILSVAGVIGGTIYMKVMERQQALEAANASASLEEQERQAMEEAARKQAEEELQRRIAQAKMEGYEAGEKDVLDHIQYQLSNGTSVVEMLRLLYADQLVVASGGQYHFIPIDETMKKNTYQMEHLSTLDSGELQYMEGGEVTSYKGIDVSKFQGKIDWQQVAQDGVSFAFIRVGYRGYGEKGVLAEDETARANLQGANDAGIKTGVYFYTQAITKEEAVEEARMVLDIIAPYRIDCPVVIDVERVSNSSGRMNSLDPQTRTDVVKAFCETVAAAGYRPMIYYNLEMGAVMLHAEQLEAYEKWFAYYKTEFYYPYAYQIWQYSDKGRVKGISGDVDMNIAFVPIWSN